MQFQVRFAASLQSLPAALSGSSPSQPPLCARYCCLLATCLVCQLWLASLAPSPVSSSVAQGCSTYFLLLLLLAAPAALPALIRFTSVRLSHIFMFILLIMLGVMLFVYWLLRNSRVTGGVHHVTRISSTGRTQG